MNAIARGEIIEDLYELLMNKVILPKCAPIQGALFHCTNVEGCFGMIDSNSLWLTDVQMMNDPSEHEYGLHLVDVEIDKRIRELPDGYLRRALLGLKSYLASDEESPRNIQRPFAFSFCAGHDVLGHWREYADHGKGIELEFCIQALNETFAIPSSDLNLALAKVQCDPMIQLDIVKQVLDDFEIFAQEWLKGATNPFQWNDLLIHISVIFRDLIAFLVSAFKAPAYGDEREVRLFAYPKLIQWETDFSYLKKRETRYGEATYFALPGKSELPIISLTRGPLCKLTHEELRQKLAWAGRQNVKIKNSMVPMRP